MDANQSLLDTQPLFNHWMNEIKTNDRYKDLSPAEIEKIQINSKHFLTYCLNSSSHIGAINPNEIKPLLDFLRSIRKTHQQQGLSIRDTTLLTLSLKSSVSDYLKQHQDSQASFEGLNDLLDIFSILSFELYSQEQETLVGKQAEQIKYLQHATDRAFGTLIGQSNAMKVVYQAIGLVLENDISVLLQGESGTGKDVIANAIHRHSNRKNQPFIAINCGAIPEHLIESELFGHEKGAFTGADSRRLGKFELANNGTLFLDEISELNLDQQKKLLRALQNNEIQRVGGNDTIRINVRIISASNKPLETLVANDAFRLDLFYRINVFPIHIPRLVDRENDVLLLAHHFIETYSAKLNLPASSLTPSANQYLLNQTWPGNIRELENMIQRAIIISNGKPITEHALSYLPGKSTTLPQLPQPITTQPPPFIPMSLADHEASIIQQTLAHFNGNIKLTASTLKVSRTTLYNKLKAYQIPH